MSIASPLSCVAQGRRACHTPRDCQFLDSQQARIIPVVASGLATFAAHRTSCRVNLTVHL